MSNHFSAANLKYPGGDARLDLTDLFVFSPPAAACRTVLIIDASPFLAGPDFHPRAVYRINIDNDGDLHADAAFTFIFSPPAEGPQVMTAYYATGRLARQREPVGEVLVAAALGAYLGRDLTYGVGFVAFIIAFGILIGMRFAARRSESLAVGLLGIFGVLLGVAVAPTLAYYAAMNPDVLWEAGGATALFIGGFGAAGYATRRDLTAVARVAFWALLALIVAGLVLVFVHIPGAALAYSVIGLVIFAAFTMFDFQRLRRNADISSAPLLAASIFLDILNVFLFFLTIFSGGSGEKR